MSTEYWIVLIDKIISRITRPTLKYLAVFRKKETKEYDENKETKEK